MTTCLKAPKVTIPTLPGGLSYAPPSVSTPSFSAGICCKTQPIPALQIPVPLPPILLVGLSAVLKEAQAEINAVLDQVQLSCPRE